MKNQQKYPPNAAVKRRDNNACNWQLSRPLAVGQIALQRFPAIHRSPSQQCSKLAASLMLLVLLAQFPPNTSPAQHGCYKRAQRTQGQDTVHGQDILLPFCKLSKLQKKNLGSGCTRCTMACDAPAETKICKWSNFTALLLVGC
eukprot:1374385-Amphidinium_carterae.1